MNGDAKVLARLEAVRAHGAVAMGVAKDVEEATTKRLATPKICFVSPPQDYTASNGKPVRAQDIAVTARIVSMGRLHHAMTGTGAVAIAVAAAIPGTIVHAAVRPGTPSDAVRFGHPSGTLAVGAEARQEGGEWKVTKAVMSVRAPPCSTYNHGRRASPHGEAANRVRWGTKQP